MEKTSKKLRKSDKHGDIVDKVINDSADFPFYQHYHDPGYVQFHEKRPRVALKDKRSASIYNLQNGRKKNWSVIASMKGLSVARISISVIMLSTQRMISSFLSN